MIQAAVPGAIVNGKRGRSSKFFETCYIKPYFVADFFRTNILSVYLFSRSDYFVWVLTFELLTFVQFSFIFILLV
jgi:hypothetical protein